MIIENKDKNILSASYVLGIVLLNPHIYTKIYSILRHTYELDCVTISFAEEMLQTLCTLPKII